MKGRITNLIRVFQKYVTVSKSILLRHIYGKKKINKFHSCGPCRPSGGHLFLCKDAAEHLSLRDTKWSPLNVFLSLTEILKTTFISRKRTQSTHDEESAQCDDRLTDHNIYLYLEGCVKRNWSVYTQYVFGVDPSTNVMLNCSRYLYTLMARHCNEYALYMLLCLYGAIYFHHLTQL